MKYSVAGLGNIGMEYELTRHNIGFPFLTDVDIKGFTFSTGRYADKADGNTRTPTHFIKPNTYMNLSGKAIAYWLQD